ncbi:hypothetical protein JTB14_013137 [Gonioctena quinquepunctata]|nr:hypothetical protein JTB14_013137 [Gonioctena quinquepunctata]
MNVNKRSKTHPSQWISFLYFAEKNPVVFTKKFEGPFGKEKYNQLWAELINSLNSMGYIVKTTEKWQKAVADWKEKVKTKAAEIKIELKKTVGGGIGRLLSEIEKRLIALMGWKSIRGDGTLELGCPSTCTIPEQTPEIQIGLEHDYHFQVVPPTHRNVSKSPPPLIGISSKTNESKESETSRHEPNLILTPQQSPIHTPNISVVENNSRKRKLPVPRKPSNSPKRRVTVNLQNMHSETIDILREINSNIKRMADSQEELCGIHGKILDILQRR